MICYLFKIFVYHITCHSWAVSFIFYLSIQICVNSLWEALYNVLSLNDYCTLWNFLPNGYFTLLVWPSAFVLASSIPSPFVASNFETVPPLHTVLYNLMERHHLSHTIQPYGTPSSLSLKLLRQDIFHKQDVWQACPFNASKGIGIQAISQAVSVNFCCFSSMWNYPKRLQSWIHPF